MLFGLCFVLFYFHDKDLVVYVLISIGLVTISTKPLANVRCIEGTYNTSRLKNILLYRLFHILCQIKTCWLGKEYGTPCKKCIFILLNIYFFLASVKHTYILTNVQTLLYKNIYDKIYLYIKIKGLSSLVLLSISGLWRDEQGSVIILKITEYWMEKHA